MASSLPSKKIAVVDVPEVKGFSAKFRYNFFTRDERTNDSGTTPLEFIEDRRLAKFDEKFIDSVNFNRFTPRFVELAWTPRTSLARPSSAPNISIRENFKKIHNEQTFTTDEYTNVNFQDTGEDSKLRYFVDRTLEEVQSAEGEDEETKSPLDVVKFLKERTDSRIRPSFIENAFTRLKDRGYTFLSEQNQEIVEKGVLQRLKSVKSRTQINNKVLNDLTRTISQNSVSIFTDDTRNLLERSRQVQDRARADKNSALIDGRDYDFEVVEFVNVRKVDPNSFDPTLQVIGYVIDKTEYTNRGEVVEHDPLIVESPFSGKTADLKVRYGTNYAYSIRAIGLIELQVEDSETNSILGLSFLVSSKPSERMVVKTEEEIPPPPPSDFKIDWDFTEKAPRLIWSFPPNSQRDIKQFQVFRRSSINEPFELLKQYDFDNSVVRSPQAETPNPELVERLDGPKSFFFDKDFEKDSKAIYAVCSVDAHGFTSNYSVQYEVAFDRFKNKIRNKLVSLSGAPKAYPNMFLQRDTFVDAIKDSGHSKVRIFFNPEYLSVVDSDGNDLKLLRTDVGSEYRLQLINVDLQQQHVVKTKLLDKRTEDEKS